jgi:hypothetical protein
MQNLIAYLEKIGVKLQRNEAVTGFEKSGNKINKVFTTDSNVIIKKNTAPMK